MPRTLILTRPRRDRRALGAVVAVVALLGGLLGLWQPAASADTAPNQVDLRVLVISDGTNWAEGFKQRLDEEGIPHTDVNLWDAGRPIITAGFLSAGTEASYQAVFTPDGTAGNLPVAELAALRAYEAQFGVREVDGYLFPSVNDGAFGATWTGPYEGKTATVTAAGKANGFGYLNGPVVYGPGSFTYLANALTPTSSPPLAPGDRFTTLVSGTADGFNGSIIGVFAHAGVERMIITSAFANQLYQYQVFAHGIITWATRGVHLGYSRNYFTMHVDDAFSSDNTWDAAHNCTPGEDCPLGSNGQSLYPELPIRMTADDVTQAAQWSAANGYQLTLAFNGFYADAATDALTQAFQTQKNAFRWLNHGFEHIYQGCQQDFTVVPWRCVANPVGSTNPANLAWVSQSSVSNEINNNVTVGNSLGLPFNAAEYLSGEHSGLTQNPQQPADNPNFVAAVSQAHLAYIGADASREPTPRVVGGALTVPRHPTAIYYNAGSIAQEIDEYNYLYNTRANGGSGYCEDNPTTATCLPAPLGADGFTNYIVPTDATFDLHFILGNDPRPFYAHVSNLAGDRILYPLLDKILGSYRGAFAGNAPIENLTMTQAGTALQRQTAWAATRAQVSAYVKDGKVTINNSGGGTVPITVPNGTTVAGVSLESYAGELSGWLPATGTTSATLPTPTLSVNPTSLQLQVGQAGTINITATASLPPTLAATGTLPAGLVLTDNGDGTGTIAGTPAPGSSGSYPVTVMATSGSGQLTQAVTIVVAGAVTITSAASATATVGQAFSFAVTASGTAPITFSSTGTLPAGVTFNQTTGTLSGTPAAGTGGRYPLTFTAANASGTSSPQAFTLTVNQAPAFTSANTASVAPGTALSFKVTTTGFPVPAITRTGTLPTGLTFVDNKDGTATFGGTTTQTGSFVQTLIATNGVGTAATQSFTLTVGSAPVFTSAATANANTGIAFSFTVRTTGSPAATITESGALPPGISFVARTPANGTATLSGTATTTGTFPVTFTATSSQGTVTQNFTLTVRTLPTFTSPASATPIAGQPFTFKVVAAGAPTPALTRTGQMPTGLVWVANADGTATISGTPAADAGGTWSATFTATSSAGTASQSFLFTVNQPAAFSSAASANWTLGAASSFTVRATGYPRPTVALSSALPPGVQFTPAATGTGTLSGTPTQAGAFPITFTATNSLGTVQQTFTLTVRLLPAFTSPASAAGTRGQAFSFVITTTGFPTPTLSRTGTLPPGVTFTANADGTARLAGTPTTAGTYPLTITARNGLGTVTQTLTVQVT